MFMVTLTLIAKMIAPILFPLIGMSKIQVEKDANTALDRAWRLCGTAWLLIICRKGTLDIQEPTLKKMD